MIRHIVSFHFLDEAEGRSKLENMKLAKEGLEALPQEIPFIRATTVYLGIPDEDPSRYDLTLISDFDNKEDLEAYVVHPAHKKFGEFMKKVRDGRVRVDVEL